MRSPHWRRLRLVVTVTFTTPLPVGDSAEMEVALLTWNRAVEPSSSLHSPPLKFVPVIVTTVPPDAGPFDGDTEVTDGAVT